MKYLFFDIECSNCFGGIGKMCEFGYVLTDENFKIISQDDIPMSPGNRHNREVQFHLRGRKDQKDIELAYEEDYYFTCPEFPHFYKRLKNLIEDEDTICFAFSMANDISHLYNACKRYGLEPFNYICFDAQIIVDRYLDNEKSINLENACKRLVGPNSLMSLCEHLSRDDAKMTMMIIEAICTIENISSNDLIEKVRGYASVNSLEQIERTLLRKAQKQEKAKAHDLYRKKCKEYSHLINDSNYVGKRINVAGLIKCDYELTCKVLDRIIEKDCIPVDYISHTDLFIVKDESNREKIESKIDEPFNGKYVFIDEFMNN